MAQADRVSRVPGGLRSRFERLLAVILCDMHGGAERSRGIDEALESKALPAPHERAPGPSQSSALSSASTHPPVTLQRCSYHADA
jgi:hypothetical protein